MLILLQRFNLFDDERLNPQIPFNSGSLAISSYAILWLISNMRVNSKGTLVPVPQWRITWILPVRQESNTWWGTWLNILGMEKLFCSDFANCWLINLLSFIIGLFRLKCPCKMFYCKFLMVSSGSFTLQYLFTTNNMCTWFEMAFLQYIYLLVLIIKYNSTWV